jgi:hypothetical protein
MEFAMLIAIVAAQIAKLGGLYDEYGFLHIGCPSRSSNLVPRSGNYGRLRPEKEDDIVQGRLIKVPVATDIDLNRRGERTSVWSVGDFGVRRDKRFLRHRKPGGGVDGTHV